MPDPSFFEAGAMLIPTIPSERFPMSIASDFCSLSLSGDYFTCRRDLADWL